MKDVLYFAPTELTEALKFLAQYGEKATVLAGGTDLVPRMNYYELKPEVLVYIGNLGLDYIEQADGKLVIGAATPTAKIAASPLIAEKAAALAEAARLSASPAIRTAGTIGGNLANASPAADLATPLIALGATVVLVSATGEREVPVEDFFTGPGQTVLQPGELIKEVRVPVRKGKSVFLKLGRRKAMTLSVVNVAVYVEMEKGQKCVDARVALGAMAPVPLRCKKAEGVLQGCVLPMSALEGAEFLDKARIEKAAELAIAESSPIDDQRATAWYRRKAGKVLVARALAAAAGIAI
ncbi:MAG: xanthine dehydrogenase family protein subunit M [Chloroflexi bacterium]|nr:xanthine dehydrogenase family protein subunit M [Chloroflexota bacterium]